MARLRLGDDVTNRTALVQVVAIVAAGVIAFAAPLAWQSDQLSPTRVATNVNHALFSVDDEVAVTRQYNDLVVSLDPEVGQTLYDAYQRGLPLVHAAFLGDDEDAQLAMLQKTAGFIESLPTYGQLIKPSIGAGLAVNLQRRDGAAGAVGTILSKTTDSFDGLAIEYDPRLDDYRLFPMRSDGRLRITSGNAQQFAYLLSSMVRLAAVRSPPSGREAEWMAAVRVVHAFVLHDTLRLYWTEMPAWHWAGAYPNMRERTAARLRNDPKLAPRVFFRAFTDYDMHVLAIGADLAAAHRSAPWLAPNAADRLLAREVAETGLTVLRLRADLGIDGRGFGFDRGYWRDNPVAAYALCRDLVPPRQECRWEAYVTDVSHGQRWPMWLDSFAAAARDTPEATWIAALRRGLARDIADKVIRYDAADRPIMTNFIDGNDGWYNLTEESGHRPSSLTGWSMRGGAWALLFEDEPRLADAYRRFCEVISSSDPDDIKFRIRFYGAPGPNRENGFVPTQDDFGATSFWTIPCKIYLTPGVVGSVRVGEYSS